VKKKLKINQIRIKQQLGTTQLRNTENQRGQMDKDVTYFLMEFAGNPDFVKIERAEGYIGIHKRCTLNEVLSLIYYQDIRELIRKSYSLIKDGQKNQNIKKDFINKGEGQISQGGIEFWKGELQRTENCLGDNPLVLDNILKSGIALYGPQASKIILPLSCIAHSSRVSILKI
jgi:hypothetical protein